MWGPEGREGGAHEAEGEGCHCDVLLPLHIGTGGGKREGIGGGSPGGKECGGTT